MKRYHVTFVDDDGRVHGIKVWAHNEDDAIIRATKKINGIATLLEFTEEDAVCVERIYPGEE